MTAIGVDDRDGIFRPLGHGLVNFQVGSMAMRSPRHVRSRGRRKSEVGCWLDLGLHGGGVRRTIGGRGSIG